MRGGEGGSAVEITRTYPGRRRRVGRIRSVRRRGSGSGDARRARRARATSRRRDRGFAAAIRPGGAHQSLGLIRHVVEHRSDPVILRQALLVRHGLVPEVGAYRALQPLDLLVGLARALEQRGRHGTRAGLSCGPRGRVRRAGANDLESAGRLSAVCSLHRWSWASFCCARIHRHNSSALRWARGEDDDGLGARRRRAARQRRRDGGTSSEEEEDASNKGTKRKRAPRTKGPCEHGVKPRSKCKVCGACPHGKWRHTCKECGGGSICEHGRRRSRCKECGGSQICEHGRIRSSCKECGGSSICEHGRERSQCKECGGSQICEHGRVRSLCKDCGGGSICEHGRRRYQCKECGGSQICEHGRVRSLQGALGRRISAECGAIGESARCKECGGSGICEHGRQRSKCKECGGSGICEHGRQRHLCRSAVVHQSASTVQGSAVGLQSASTVVSALSARSAVGLQICEHGRRRHQCKECRAAKAKQS